MTTKELKLNEGKLNIQKWRTF